MQIAGRGFLVSGGASGLGAAAAAMLVSAGGRVLLADRDPDAGHATAAALGAAAQFLQTDVTDPNQAQAAVATAVERFGGLHGLVNCAGIAPAERTLGRDGPHALETFARTVAVNLTGSFNMARLAAVALATNLPIDGERGVIVHTASIAAQDGQVGQVAYAASKAGVAGMTLPMARDLARHGIRVMTVAPGLFRTPMMAGLPGEVQESLGRAVPFPSRLGEPSEYAALVRHIFENPMLNGEVIRLDGALRLPPK